MPSPAEGRPPRTCAPSHLCGPSWPTNALLGYHPLFQRADMFYPTPSPFQTQDMRPPAHSLLSVFNFIRRSCVGALVSSHCTACARLARLPPAHLPVPADACLPPWVCFASHRSRPAPVSPTPPLPLPAQSTLARVPPESLACVRARAAVAWHEHLTLLPRPLRGRVARLLLPLQSLAVCCLTFTLRLPTICHHGLCKCKHASRTECLPQQLQLSRCAAAAAAARAAGCLCQRSMRVQAGEQRHSRRLVPPAQQP